MLLLMTRTGLGVELTESHQMKANLTALVIAFGLASVLGHSLPNCFYYIFNGQ